MNNKAPLIEIETQSLKRCLNALYGQKPLRNRMLALHFDALWDLKEKALLEGKSSVFIPQPWLQEVEESLQLVS